MTLRGGIRAFSLRRLFSNLPNADPAQAAATAEIAARAGDFPALTNYPAYRTGLWLFAHPATRERLWAFFVALVATLVFYAQSLASKSLRAGFLYTVDCWNVWLPQIGKVNAMIQGGAFSGIDFSTHGGASEFFIRAGLFPYHPLVLLYSLVFTSGAPGELMRPIVVIYAMHSFAGCYFAMRLVSRHLRLGAGPALVVGVGYAFSEQIVWALGFCPFFLSTSLLPCAVYAGFETAVRPSLRNIVLYSLAPLAIFLGGYSLIAFACAALAWALVAAHLIYVDTVAQPARVRAMRLAVATLPFVLAGIVVLPLYWAMIQYFPLVGASQAPSLFFSAHQLAEQPRTILRLLSRRLEVPGPFAEFTLSFGMVTVVIGGLFFAGLRRFRELQEGEWRLLKVCGATYALLTLAIYGNYSPVSDLFFFIPGIGMMHIYQRHLVAAQLLLVIVIALMLKAITRRRSHTTVKAAMFILVGLLAYCAFAVSRGTTGTTPPQLNDYIIFELFCALLLTAALLTPGKRFVFVAAAFLMLLPPLDHMFDFSTLPEYHFNQQRPRNLAVDDANNARLLAYFRAHSSKAIIKYVDLLPGIDNYVPRNYPWYTVRELPLSTYGGYDFSHAPRAAYSRVARFTAFENSIWVLRPDWRWVAKTGGEFAVYQEGFRYNDPHLDEVLDQSDPAKVLRLPNGIVVAPLRRALPSTDFSRPPQGRYVRIQLDGSNHLSLAEVRVLVRQAGVPVNVAQGRKATQSSIFNPTSGAANAVDGNTNGDFTLGSVTATNLDPQAWWQVDLGEAVPIEAVEIWNRTDGSQERLENYWVFVSDQPFSPADTPTSLKGRAGVVVNHQTMMPNPSTVIRSSAASGGSESWVFDNGYLRVLGPAEGVSVRNFQTDGASDLNLDLDLKEAARVQYLFWPNERLRFYLHGRRVSAAVEDGLLTVHVPPGRQRLNIRYEYWPSRLFLLLYCSYAIVFAGAVLAPVLRPAVNRYARPRMAALLARIQKRL